MKHECTDHFRRTCTLAECNRHPKWSVIKTNMWGVYPPMAWRAAAFRETWEEALAYANQRAVEA